MLPSNAISEQYTLTADTICFCRCCCMHALRLHPSSLYWCCAFSSLLLSIQFTFKYSIREPVNSSHRKIVWRVDRPFWPSIRPIQELRRRRWLRYCTLAVITPSVLSTVSGCYLTGVQKKKITTGSFVMCSLVTSWLCDETLLWRVDRWRIDW